MLKTTHCADLTPHLCGLRNRHGAGKRAFTRGCELARRVQPGRGVHDEQPASGTGHSEGGQTMTDYEKLGRFFALTREAAPDSQQERDELLQTLSGLGLQCLTRKEETRP